MATTAELILQFKGDPTNLKSVMSEVRAELNKTAGTQKDVNRNVKTQADDTTRVLSQVAASQVQFGEKANLAKLSLLGLGKTIGDLSAKSKKSVGDVQGFVQSFVKLETQAQRDTAAINFFGAALAQKLTPQLNNLIRLNRSVTEETKPVAVNLQTITDLMQALGSSSAALQGPLGGVAGRLRSVGALATEAGGGLGVAGVAAAAAVVSISALALGMFKLNEALFNVAKSAAAFEGKFFDLSQQLGVTAETLSAIDVLLSQTGGNLDSAAAALGIFQRRLEDALDPQSKSAELFSRLRVEVKDTETTLRATLAALAAMPEGFSQTSLALELFGRSGKQVLAVLKESNGDIDEATRRFQRLALIVSTEDARAADKFNDSLEILNRQFQALTRQIGREFLPAALELVQAFSQLITASSAFFGAIGPAGGAILNAAAQGVKGLGLAVAALTLNYRALAEAAREAHERTQIRPIEGVPSPQPVPLPSAPTERDLLRQAEEQASAAVSAVKRAAEETNQRLRQLFQEGRLRRQQLVEESIAQNRRIAEAEIAEIDARITRLTEEAKAQQGETEARRKAISEIEKLQQQRLDIESRLRTQNASERARAAKEESDALRNEKQNETEIVVGELDNQIKRVQALLDRQEGVETENLTILELLERSKAATRIEGLQQQIQIGNLSIDEQRRLNADLQKLQQEQDHLTEEQERRRESRSRATIEQRVALESKAVDAITRLAQISAGTQVASLQELARTRIRSEEETARAILRVRLNLLNVEEQAIRARLTAAKTIADPRQRTQVETDLNNQLRILNAERVAIQADGDRQIEAGRQKDLDNERRYANELLEIRQRAIDIERETAQAAIALMLARGARRRDIVQAQFALAVADENERHRQELASIAAQRTENAESNRSQAEKLQKTQELNRLEEAEAARHKAEMDRLRGDEERERIKSGPFGGFLSGLETGQLVELANGVQSFADVATVAFSAVGAAVNGLAQGVGALVQQWVLMGNQADLSLKKVTASVLSSVSAQAAVQAVMFLAYGIASLTPWGAAIFGPAGPWFKAAALMASIAVVAGGIGRAVAGNSFAGGGEQPGGPTAQQPQTERDRTIRERRTGGGQEFARRDEGKVEVTLKLDSEVLERVIVKRFQRNGQLRSTLRNDLLNEAGA